MKFYNHRILQRLIDCTSNLMNTFHKSTVNNTRAQAANEKNEHNDVNDGNTLRKKY